VEARSGLVACALECSSADPSDISIVGGFPWDFAFALPLVCAAVGAVFSASCALEEARMLSKSSDARWMS
jgi:hypothetical protein